MLNNARYMRDSHLAERVCPVASVVEDQPVLGIDRVEEIGAEADGDPDDTDQGARWRIVLDVLGLHPHGAEKAQVVRR